MYLIRCECLGTCLIHNARSFQNVPLKDIDTSLEQLESEGYQVLSWTPFRLAQVMKFFQSYRSLELNLTHKSPLTKIGKFHINSVKSMCHSFQRSIFWVLLWKPVRNFQVYTSRLSRYFVPDWSKKNDICYHGIMNLEETHKAFRSSTLPKLWNYIPIVCRSQLNLPHHSKGSHDISIVHETIVEGFPLL